VNWYVYLLHFSSPLGTKLHQAEHYVGLTNDLPSRLQEHRTGRGAKITQAAVERGLALAIGALGLVSSPDLTPRQAERRMKTIKHAARYCELCAGRRAKRMPGTTPQPRKEA
jgi:predicted GIY-YIG superfamily endonuclease